MAKQGRPEKLKAERNRQQTATIKRKKKNPVQRSRGTGRGYMGRGY